MRVIRDLWRAWRHGITWPICGLLLVAVPVRAQSIPPSPQGLTAQYSSACAASTCATWTVGTATSVTVSVTGAGSWTGTFKASSDNGNTYFDATMIRLSDRSTTTTVTDTGDGQYGIVNSGITHLQFRLTTWVSGGANVWAIRGYGSPMALPFSSGSPVPASGGGTGFSSYAVGDLLTADTTTTLAKLADVAVGSVLISGGVGVVPSWSAAPLVTSINFGSSVLVLDAANILAQRNGTNGQSFRIYNTYTDASNYSRFNINTNSTLVQISTSHAGSGTTRSLEIGTVGSSIIDFFTNNSSRWTIGATTGNLLPASGVGIGLAVPFAINTAPTTPVACTSPTVTWSNGTAAFQIDVGSSCAGVTTLVVTLPAVTNAWSCNAINVTTSATAAVEMTASTTTTATFTNYTRTTGIVLAWVDGADVRINCLGG